MNVRFGATPYKYVANRILEGVSNKEAGHVRIELKDKSTDMQLTAWLERARSSRVKDQVVVTAFQKNKQTGREMENSELIEIPIQDEQGVKKSLKTLTEEMAAAFRKVRKAQMIQPEQFKLA